MAVGGEGAPLVPYSETLLYGEDHQAVALQNIWRYRKCDRSS